MSERAQVRSKPKNSSKFPIHMGITVKAFLLLVLVNFTCEVSLAQDKLNLDTLQGKSSVEYFGYPVPPRTTERLFFIQRNISKNVVVYDANLKESGKLDVKDPAKIYWKRYNGNQGGKERELKWIERNWAYKLKIFDTEPNHAIAAITAYKHKKFRIIQQEDGLVEAIVRINGRDAIMHYIFMHMVEGSVLHDVNYLEVGGEDLETGEIVFEQFRPK